MGEAQKAAVEGKLASMQEMIMDLQSRLNREIGEREADESTMSNK